jgi:hypothetical protein
VFGLECVVFLSLFVTISIHVYICACIADSEIKVTCDDPAVLAPVPSDMVPHLDKFQSYSDAAMASAGSGTDSGTGTGTRTAPQSPSPSASTDSVSPANGPFPASPLPAASATASAVRPQTTRTVSSTVKLWLRGPRHDSPKWIYLKYNSTFSFHKVYHLEFYWIST